MTLVDTRSTGSPRLKFVLLVLPILVAIYYFLAPPSAPLVMPDTASYIHFFPDRPIGYPFILYLTKTFFGNYDKIRYLQMSAYCLAVAVLAFGVASLTRSVLTALIIEMGILLHPGPMSLAQSMMSDSLSLSAILFYAAMLIRFLDAPSMKRFAALCAIMAFAVTLRPVNLSLFPVAALAGFICWKKTSRPGWIIALTGLAICAVGVEASPIANRFINGTFGASSPLARGFVQKVLFLERSSDRVRRPDCGSDYIDSVTDPVNEYLKAAPSQFQSLLRFDYSQILRFEVILPGLAERHGLHSPSEVNPMLMCFTVARLRTHPMVLMSESVGEYWNLISNFTFIDQRAHDQFAAYLTAHPPAMPPGFKLAEPSNSRPGGRTSGDESLRPIDPAYFDPPKPRNHILIRGLQIFQFLGVGISLGFLIDLLHSLGRLTSPIRLLIGFLALSAQLLLLATAIVEMAQPRYFFPVWPLLWSVIALSGLIAYRWAGGPTLAPRPHCHG